MVTLQATLKFFYRATDMGIVINNGGNMVFQYNRGLNKGRLVVIIRKSERYPGYAEVMLADRREKPLLNIETGEPIKSDISVAKFESLTLSSL